MKIVILAGGLGSRLSEETTLKPKPMVEIGGRPILWHIMKHYAACGFNEFVICLGYKGYYIKEYFSNYMLHQSDVTINLKDSSFEIHNTQTEDWKVTLVDTGPNTMTGARVKLIEKYIDGTFMLTYGDGLSDVNANELLKYHRSHGKIGTLTAIQPSEARFGILDLCDDSHLIKKFTEKPKDENTWINGGFFVFEKEFFKYLDGDLNLILERSPFEKLSAKEEFVSYRHKGFWKCMDTLRDKEDLEKLWGTSAPWKNWK